MIFKESKINRKNNIVSTTMWWRGIRQREKKQILNNCVIAHSRE